jgi:hypothetical protein
LKNSGLSIIPKNYNLPEKIKVLFDSRTDVYQFTYQFIGPHSGLDSFETHVLEYELDFTYSVPSVCMLDFQIHDAPYFEKDNLITQLCQKILNYLGKDVLKVFSLGDVRDYKAFKYLGELTKENIYYKITKEAKKHTFLINTSPKLAETVSRKFEDFVYNSKFIDNLYESVYYCLIDQIKDVSNKQISQRACSNITAYMFLETNEDLSDGDLFLLVKGKICPFVDGLRFSKIGKDKFDYSEIWDFDIYKDACGEISDKFLDYYTNIAFVTDKIYLDKSRKLVRNFIDKNLVLLNLYKLEMARRKMNNNN